MIGQTFGRLRVLARAQWLGADRYICVCECGGFAVGRKRYLIDGRKASCGCLLAENAERLRRMRTVHGETVGSSRSRIYEAWCGMRQRCENPSNKRYPLYGGRGIKVAPEWHDFERFAADMGPPPLGKSIDRIDVNGDYAPGNCRWATQAQQSQNTRYNTIDMEIAREIRRLSAAGLRPIEINQRLGVHRSTIHAVKAGRQWLEG